MKKMSQQLNRRSGFTLLEVMTASFVVMILTALVLSMLMAIVRQSRTTEIKNSVSNDYRKMTRQLVEQGNMSNRFFIYPSFADQDRNDASKRISPYHTPSESSGDFVIFIFFSIKDIKTSPNLQGISRVMGAFREKTGNEPSAIRWFDSAQHDWGQNFSSAKPAIIPTDDSGIESLLPPESFATRLPVLANHARGAASYSAGGDYNLFYNNDKSLHITGFITRFTTTGENHIPTTDVLQSQNVFNLTISPRSQ